MQTWWQRFRDKKRLLKAVNENNLARVTELVRRMPREQINYVPMIKPLFECTDPGRRGDCALLRAATQRNAAIVAVLLEYGADPNTTNEEGLSALVVACENGDLDIVKELLAHGANPNIPSPAGSFPLHIAARNLLVEIAEVLLSRGADVNLRESRTQDTPLHVAVLAPSSMGFGNSLRIAITFINTKRVDYSMRNAVQDTALHKATQLGNTELVGAMVDADACTNLLDAGGQTALHIAIGRYGSTAAGTNMAVCLVQAQRTDVNMLSWSGLPPLLMAVRAANLTVVKALLDRDTVDPNILSAPEKAAPLHTAIQQVPRELPLRRGDAPTPSEAIALAICSNSKVDVNLEDGDAHRPVFLAVTCCSSRVLARLLEKGVNLGARDRDGYTPALKATLLAVEGHGPAAAVDGTTAATERASMVIKAAPNISATGGPLGNTALHMSVSVAKGSMVLFTLLMGRKADINVLNKAGDSPLHAAVRRVEAISHAKQAAIGLIKSGRAKLDLPNSSRDTALTLAAARHCVTIMSELVAAGANVNVSNTAADTAMHLACRFLAGGPKPTWGPAPAQVLLGSKALKLDLVNAQGQTALLALASTVRWWGSAVAVAEAMVAQGSCSFNTLDKAGLTALHYMLGAGPRVGSLGGLGHGPAMALHLIACKGCDVNVVSRDKAAEAALHRVASLGLPEVCRALLGRSANANIANGAALTPLHIAVLGAKAAHTCVAEQLIDNAQTGVDIRAKADGRTALLMVVVQSKEALVERLIKRGADPNIADGAGATPLHVALRAAGVAGASSAVGTRLSLALVAYAKTNVDTKSPQGFAPIHAAVRLPSLPIAKALIGRRADLDSVDGSGSAALHLAIAMDGKAPGKAYEPIAVALVEGGANPSQADSAATSTPLHLVASCGAGNLAIYRALARRGAATNALNKHGMSALHLAIQSAAASGAADCAFDAIAQGITETEASNVNLATADGAHITPMLMCIKGARPTVLTSLIKRRADANVASKVGELPLLAALEKAEGKTAHAAVARKMAKELIDSGLPNVDTARAKDLSTPAHFATRMAASELLASLIARRANFGLRDTSGSTVMHVATRMACPENATGLAIMKQLVVGKAPADVQDKQGRTALHYAVTHRGGSLAAVCYLMEQRDVGVGADLVDAAGATALHCAIGLKSQKGVDMALAVIKSGKANPDVLLPDGSSPTLMVVKLCPSASVLTALLAAGANCSLRNKAQEAPLLVALGLLAVDKAREMALRTMALALASHRTVDRDVQEARTGNTALHLAVPVLFAQLVDVLVGGGANVNRCNTAGSAPIHTALQHALTTASLNPDARAIAMALIKGGDVNLKDADGWTALMMTVGCGQGSLPLFEAVVARGPQVDLANRKGTTALHLATARAADSGDASGTPFTAMGRALLAAGANPNITAPAYGGGTALHMAIQEGRGSPAMFAQLMATKSTDVNALDSGGSSPLHAALHQTVFDDPAAKAAQAVQMAVKIAASGRANLRLADASGQSPLVKAVKRSILPVVKVLLSAGVPCNDVDPATGQVPVIIASEKLAFLAVRQSKDSGCAGTLLALLAHPATNVNARNVSGRTPLHLLLRNGATAGLAATVLQQCCKLDLNVQDNDRNTPLHVALKELYPANQAAATPLVVTMVKRSGTRLDIPDARRDTAMHLACKCNEEVFTAVSDACLDKDVESTGGLKPIHIVMQVGEPWRLHTFLRCGRYDVNAVYRGKAPLHMALAHGPCAATPLVKALMARGANMNVVDNSGSTALTLALRRKMPDELVFVLIHAPGIKLDVFDRLTGNLALVTAVLDNRLNLATAMLQAGASPSARNRDGDAPIHSIIKATWANSSLPRLWRFTSTTMLIKHRCDLSQRDGNGKVPMLLLLNGCHNDDLLPMAIVLLDAGAPACNELDTSSGLGWIHLGCHWPEFISKWHKAGGDLSLVAHFGRVRSYANIMLPSSHGWNVPAGRVADAMFEGVNANVTAITLAALGGWPNAVTTLLDLGVSPNVGRQCGAKAVTPFMVALLQSQTSLASSLLSRGACVNGEGNGINPLAMAIQVSKGLLGMGAGYGSSYSLESVAGAVAQRLAMFAAREARNLLMNDANMTGSVADLTESAADFAHGAGADEVWNEAVFGAGDVGNEVLGHAGTEVLGDAGTEVVGEVATELLGTVLDVVFPGLTLLRWGFRLMSASAVQARAAPRRFTYRDALSLSATGALSVVGWLLSAGPEVTLGDPGMAEMVSMMVSDEQSGAGWQWAGLSLRWPSSFEPHYSRGLRKIDGEYMKKRMETRTYDPDLLNAAQYRARNRWKHAVKVTVTLEALNKRCG